MKTVCCGREREIQNLGRGAWPGAGAGGGSAVKADAAKPNPKSGGRADGLSFPLPDSAFQNIDHDIPLLFTSYDHLLLKSRFKSPERGPIIRVECSLINLGDCVSISVSAVDRGDLGEGRPPAAHRAVVHRERHDDDGGGDDGRGQRRMRSLGRQRLRGGGE